MTTNRDFKGTPFVDVEYPKRYKMYKIDILLGYNRTLIGLVNGVISNEL